MKNVSPVASAVSAVRCYSFHLFPLTQGHTIDDDLRKDLDTGLGVCVCVFGSMKTSLTTFILPPNCTMSHLSSIVTLIRFKNSLRITPRPQWWLELLTRMLFFFLLFRFFTLSSPLSHLHSHLCKHFRLGRDGQERCLSNSPLVMVWLSWRWWGPFVFNPGDGSGSWYIEWMAKLNLPRSLFKAYHPCCVLSRDSGFFIRLLLWWGLLAFSLCHDLLHPSNGWSGGWLESNLCDESCY